MHNLFLVYFVNLYMFRAYLGPSSGGITVCIQQLVLIILKRQSASFVVSNCCIGLIQFCFDVLVSMYSYCLLSIAKFYVLLTVQLDIIV